MTENEEERNEEESLESLCEEYLELSSKEVDEEAIQEYEEEMEEWEGRIEELDEEDPLYDTAKGNYEEAKDKFEQEVSVGDRRSELEDSILEIVSSKFSIEDASSTQLRAINQILVGKDREHIPYVSEKVDSGTEIDDKEMFDLSMSLRDLAEDELEDGNEIHEYWTNFKELGRYRAFEVVATHNGMVDGEVLADELDETKNRAGQMVRDENRRGEYKPYYKDDGKYDLSIVGEYITEHYMSVESRSDGEDDMDESEEDVESLDSFSDN
jgi:hypothetical protein